MLRKKPGKADDYKKPPAPVTPVVNSNKQAPVPTKPTAPVSTQKTELPKKDPLDVYKLTRKHLRIYTAEQLRVFKEVKQVVGNLYDYALVATKVKEHSDLKQILSALKGYSAPSNISKESIALYKLSIAKQQDKDQIKSLLAYKPILFPQYRKPRNATPVCQLAQLYTGQQYLYNFKMENYV